MLLDILRKSKNWLLALFVVLSAAALLAQRPRAHVVIISLDGFGAWALEDPYLPVPTLRRLAVRGAIAKSMRPINPTVTWPNHTSIISGVTPAKHGVLFNGLLIREPGVPPRIEPWRDRNEMVRVKTLYDEAHARGMTTAEVDWVAIQNAPTITWAFPERPPPAGRIAQELVKAGTISQSDVESFATRNIVWRDHIWTAAASHILREHKPNLMMFHLLNLDSTQHRYGPRTPAAVAAMAHLDAQVGSIVQTIEQSGLAADTTIFVVSDHGFKAVKKQIRPNAALMKVGLLTAQQDGKVVQSQAYVVPEGGTALVYVTAPDPKGEILGRVKSALAGIEGIDSVIEPADYARLGLPDPADNNQMGALFLTAKAGYAFVAPVTEPVVVDAIEGSLGAHGYVSSDPDLDALFIASGAGVKPGVKLEAIDNLDVAPTAARLLGFELANVQGRVLKEILTAPR